MHSHIIWIRYQSLTTLKNRHIYRNNTPNIITVEFWVWVFGYYIIRAAVSFRPAKEKKKNYQFPPRPATISSQINWLMYFGGTTRALCDFTVYRYPVSSIYTVVCMSAFRNVIQLFSFFFAFAGEQFVSAHFIEPYRSMNQLSWYMKTVYRDNLNNDKNENEISCLNCLYGISTQLIFFILIIIFTLHDGSLRYSNKCIL